MGWRKFGNGGQSGQRGVNRAGFTMNLHEVSSNKWRQLAQARYSCQAQRALRCGREFPGPPSQKRTLNEAAWHPSMPGSVPVTTLGR